MSTAPAPTEQAERFTMTGWQVDDQQAAVHFDYACSRFGTFRETVSFPSISTPLGMVMDETLAGVLDLLHIAVGVSYYKCAAAKTIALPASAAHDAVREMAEALYTEGLAEFYIRAGLPFPANVAFEVADDEMSDDMPSLTASLGKPRQNNSALVAFGGGKDSYVALAIMEKAGVATTPCSVVMSDKVAATLQATAPQEILFARRALDPKLREVVQQGAFNGHVPITAINSLTLMALAHLTDHASVVFANERSADEPTITAGEETANHQYSKSSFFEAKLRAATKALAPEAPDYFSVLRPFSEIWIGRAFSQLKTPFQKFTSCNRNFQITGDKAPRWCGDCAKCAFTSLITAPFTTRDEALVMFGGIFPDRENLLPLYRELCGLTPQKPWDCVGTINECRASLWRMSQLPEWQDSLVVRELMPAVLQATNEEQLARFWEDGFTERENHFIPEEILRAARDI